MFTFTLFKQERISRNLEADVWASINLDAASSYAVTWWHMVHYELLGIAHIVIPGIC